MVGSSAAIDAASASPEELVASGAVGADGCALVSRTHLPQDLATRAEVEELRRKLSSLQTTYALQRANSVQAHRVAESLRTFFELLLESLPQPVLTVDRDGCVQRWNSAAEVVFHGQRGQADGRPLATWIGEPACGAVLRACAQAFKLGELSSTLFTDAQTVQGPVEVQPGITARKLTVLPLSRIPGWVEATIVVIDIAWQDVGELALAA